MRREFCDRAIEGDLRTGTHQVGEKKKGVRVFRPTSILIPSRSLTGVPSSPAALICEMLLLRGGILSEGAKGEWTAGLGRRDLKAEVMSFNQCVVRFEFVKR